MLPALLLLCLTTLGGFLLTYLYQRNAPLLVRFAVGTVTGTILSGLLNYGLALLFGLNPLTISLSALPPLLSLLLLRSPEIRASLHGEIRSAFRPRWRSTGHWAFAVAFVLVGALLVVLFRGAIYEESGEIWTTNHHNIGDLPWHIAIVQGFAVGENFPPQHPEFAGTRLTYPFLVDFITAQYSVCGATLPQAFLLQNLTLAAALLVLLHWWSFRLTRSVFVLTVAPLMILLSGGWAWMTLFSETREFGKPLLELLLHPPHDYTTGIEGIRWGNMLTTLLITQRGLLLTMPIALFVFVRLFEAQKPSPSRAKNLFWSGILTGLTPLSHGHTFLTLLIVAAGLAILDLVQKPSSFRDWLRDWASFFIPAGIVAFPQALVLANGAGVKKDLFFGWQPGWDTNAENFGAFLIFWYKNTGPLVLLLIFALLWRTGRGPRVSAPLRRFYLPFLLCFLLPNLFRFAPWIWDNIKILLYWFVGTVPIAALAMARMWHRGVPGKITAVFLLLCCVAAGGIDVSRLATGQSKQRVFDREGIAFAQFVREKTPPRSLLLHAGAYSHPALLTGRRLLSGYPGHLWSHGLDFEQQTEDGKRIYAGESNADALLQKYSIAYIIVGPPERSEEGYKVNDTYLSRFPIVGESGPYRLLIVKF